MEPGIICSDPYYVAVGQVGEDKSIIQLEPDSLWQELQGIPVFFDTFDDILFICSV